jgi:hypothetical protein
MPMVPLLVSVQAESMGGGTEKTDYRNLWRAGRIVHMDLFDRRGKKRKHQLQGSRFPLRECRPLDFDGTILGLRFVPFAHSKSIKHALFRACKGRWSVSH